MKIGNNNLKIHCNKLEWNNIINKFDNLLENKLSVSPEEAFNLHINKIKTLEPFKNPESDFWKEYKKLDHDNLGLPQDIYEQYNEIWSTKTWYDVLGFKELYYDYNDFNKILRTNPKLVKYSHIWTQLNEKKINKLRKIDNKLPPNFNEFYRFEIVI
jgi:hypothetical protein